MLQKYNLENDLIAIGLNSNITYNPLHKPNLNPNVLSNQIKNSFNSYFQKIILNLIGLIK